MNREISSILTLLTAIAPDAYTADEAGVIIDTQDYDALTIDAVFGDTADAAATLDIEAGDASDLSDAVALTPTEDGPGLDEFLYGPDFPIGQTDARYKWSYVGPYRYVRVNLTAATSTKANVTAILGKANDNPLA